MKLGRRENDSMKSCSLECESDAVVPFLLSPWLTLMGREAGAPLFDMMDRTRSKEKGVGIEE